MPYDEHVPHAKLVHESARVHKEAWEKELNKKEVNVEEQGEYYPSPIDLSFFESELPKDAYRTLGRLSNASAGFLSMPIVTDNITDHQERRGWRADMLARFGDVSLFLTENRLRLNKVMGVMGFADMLITKLKNIPEPSETVQDLQHLAEDIFATNVTQKEYLLLSNEEKVKKVQAISVAVRSFLDYVVTAEAEEEEYRQAA